MANLFFDIETVREYDQLADSPEDFKKAWQYALDFRYKDSEGTPQEIFQRHAPLHPEYGKIVCISYYLSGNKDVVSITDEKGEEELLVAFFSLLDAINWDITKLIGHNINRFDIPFLISRAMKYRLKIPNCLVAYGKKPWEIGHIIDTVKLYKNQNYSTTQVGSMVAVTNLLNLPSPKEEVDGTSVSEIYYTQPDPLKKIARYCEGDIKANAHIFKVFKDCNLLGDASN